MSAPTKVQRDPAVRAYKAQVLAEARRLQTDHGWCDSGVNEYLGKVGLNRRGARVPMAVTITVTRWVEVPTAIDQEEAQEMAAANDPLAIDAAQTSIRDHWGGGLTVEQVKLRDGDLDPTKVAVGDWDFTGGGLGGTTCRETDPSVLWRCTRPEGHHGMHASGSNDKITAAWGSADTKGTAQ